MIKTKKLKVTLLMGVIACFVAVFCCMQSAFANNANSDNAPLVNSADNGDFTDTNDEIKGKVEGASGAWSFRNINDFRIICFGGKTDDYLKNDKELDIFVNDDLNFHEFCCDINYGRTFNFIIDQAKWLFSTDAHTMFNVKDGNLILNCKPVSESEEQYHAFVGEPGEDSAITVDAWGKVQADHIWFREPYEGKSGPSKGGVLKYDFLGEDQVFNNCIFDHNQAKNGGAIYVDIFCDRYNLIFNNCEFDGCSAKSDGGAICTNSGHGKIKFNNTTLSNCSANSNGGALCLDSSQNSNERLDAVLFDNSIINNCSAGHRGGAVYNNVSRIDFNLKDSKISNCHSGSEGGAISAERWKQHYTLDNSNIEGCSAGNDGGAFYVFGNDVSITGTTDGKKAFGASELTNTSTIKDCSSSECGGAIYTTAQFMQGDSFEVDNINFINNKCKDDGGAIQTMNEHNEINNCVFVGNYANGTGGAVDGYAQAGWFPNQEPTVKGCEFFGNTCGDVGDQVRLSYIRTDNISGNRIYYKGDNFDPVKNIYTNHYRSCTWSDCFKAIKIA